MTQYSYYPYGFKLEQRSKNRYRIEVAMSRALLQKIVQQVNGATGWWKNEGRYLLTFKTDDVELFKASLERFLMTQNIIVEESPTLIYGYQWCLPNERRTLTEETEEAANETHD
jgi:hypothetical protein